jgi:septal ring factor EnvC (AmiA/AmiB activator)
MTRISLFLALLLMSLLISVSGMGASMAASSDQHVLKAPAGAERTDGKIKAGDKLSTLGPAPKSVALGRIDEKIEAEKAKKDELAADLKKQDKDAAKLQDKLVNIAGDVRSREKQAIALSDKVDELQDDQNALMSSLQRDRVFLQQAVNGYLQMRLAPPAVWMASPEQTREVGLGLTALHAVMPHLHDEVAVLQDKLRALDENQDTLRKQQAELAMATTSLSKQRAQMQALLAERDAQREKMKVALADQEKTISQLSAQAKDLKDLIKRLEVENKKVRAAKEVENEEKAALADAGNPSDHNPAEGGKLKKLAASLGAALPMKDDMAMAGRLPVSGKITVNYGGTDTLGAVSQGIHIAGVPGGTVTAPATGTVRYTGPFQNYGNIVLIEHRGGYHSLIAGLDKIATVVGSRVKAGEPVGSLKSSGGAPNAYFELRRDGEPVNPASHLGAMRRGKS